MIALFTQLLKVKVTQGSWQQERQISFIMTSLLSKTKKKRSWVILERLGRVKRWSFLNHLNKTSVNLLRSSKKPLTGCTCQVRATWKDANRLQISLKYLLLTSTSIAASHQGPTLPSLCTDCIITRNQEEHSKRASQWNHPRKETKRSKSMIKVTRYLQAEYLKRSKLLLSKLAMVLSRIRYR